jgi:hypothetical protein
MPESIGPVEVAGCLNCGLIEGVELRDQGALGRARLPIRSGEK